MVRLLLLRLFIPRSRDSILCGDGLQSVQHSGTRCWVRLFARIRICFTLPCRERPSGHIFVPSRRSIAYSKILCPFVCASSDCVPAQFFGRPIERQWRRGFTLCRGCFAPANCSAKYTDN